MNSYLVIYRTDKDVSAIKKGLENLRVVEYLSDHSAIVLSFLDANDILDMLQQDNPNRIPLIVVKLDAVIYTANLHADFFEPNSAQNL